MYIINTFKIMKSKDLSQLEIRQVGYGLYRV